jgi:glycine/serine hydroxymethyltransferase
MSEAVKKFYAAAISERYCVGPTAPWKYPREAHLEKIILRTEELASRIFDGKVTTVVPLSGSQCMAAIVLGVCKPGDLVMGISPADGVSACG